jgi:hypothetical protein
LKPQCKVLSGSLFFLLALIPGLSAQSADDVSLLEAVIRYEIAGLLRASSANVAGTPGPTIFCVNIRATAKSEPVDADAKLLARFKDHRPAVKPGSACEVKNWAVYEKSSGKAAAIMDYGPVVRRRNQSEAEVSGAPYVGGQVAREYLYRLRLKGKTWTVYDVELKVVT